MAQHGYLGDDYGSGFDPDYDGDRNDRRERGWGGGGDERWRADNRSGRFMFEGRERGSRQGGGDSSEWFGGRDAQRRSFSSHPDHHYLSWRDKQLEALDRDYEDYCREREQQFHRDFGSWRQQRQSQSAGQPSKMGPASSGSGGNDELLLERGSRTGRATGRTDAANEPISTANPDSAATLGEGGGGGR